MPRVGTLEPVDEAAADGEEQEESGADVTMISAPSDPASSLSNRRWSLNLHRRTNETASAPDSKPTFNGGERMERRASEPFPRHRRSSSVTSLTQLPRQSANLIMNALSRSGASTPSRSSTPVPPLSKDPLKSKDRDRDVTAKPTAGALAALGFRAAQVAAPNVLPPSPTEEKPQPITKNKSLLHSSKPVGSSSTTSSARPSRSPSPFFRARKSREERRAREKSPEITALRKDSAAEQSAAESDGESVARGRERTFRPQASAYESPDESGDESAGGGVTEDEHEHDSELDYIHSHDDFDEGEDDDFFDDQTKENTEANAIYDAPSCRPGDSPDEVPVGGTNPNPDENFDVYGEEVEQDVLGEGPNVVVPQDPVFQAPTAGVKRRTSKKGLELITSRPAYARDRCTITITQGDPDGALDKSGKRMRQYVVLSDLSEESRYAVEWAVGTVARDGDEVFVISVIEDESKVDPKNWSNKDQSLKLKVQKERQTTALLLVRQVTSLLSRTLLNITVTCQALHAKNARYMLLDLIDFLEPTLVIVGSRGLGQLKG